MIWGFSASYIVSAVEKDVPATKAVPLVQQLPFVFVNFLDCSSCPDAWEKAASSDQFLPLHLKHCYSFLSPGRWKYSML